MGAATAPVIVPKIKEKALEIIGRAAAFIPIFMGSFMDGVQNIGPPAAECEDEEADDYDR